MRDERTGDHNRQLCGARGTPDRNLVVVLFSFERDMMTGGSSVQIDQEMDQEMDQERKEITSHY